MIEALKLAFNVLARYRSRSRGPLPRSPAQGRSVLWDASRDFEEQPLQGMNGQYGEGGAVPAEGGIGQEAPLNAAPSMRMRSWLAVAFASVVWASSTYIVRLLTTSGDTAKSIFERTTSRSSLLPSFSLMRRLSTSPALHQQPSSCMAFTRLRGGASP